MEGDTRHTDYWLEQQNEALQRLKFCEKMLDRIVPPEPREPIVERRLALVAIDGVLTEEGERVRQSDIQKRGASQKTSSEDAPQGA